MKSLSLFLFLFFIIIKGNAQKLPADTVAIKPALKKAKVDSSFTPRHSPKVAAWHSAVLPGWGQAYNKKYWKIPVLYVGVASLIYGLTWNNKNYKEFRQISTYLTDNDTSTIPVYNGNVLDGRYNNWASSNRDYFRKNRDLCAIGLGAIYILNIIDANVDAHLFEFNINDDLSLRWQPSVFMINGYVYNGFGAAVKFR